MQGFYCFLMLLMTKTHMIKSMFNISSQFFQIKGKIGVVNAFTETSHLTHERDYVGIFAKKNANALVFNPNCWDVFLDTCKQYQGRIEVYNRTRPIQHLLVEGLNYSDARGMVHYWNDNSVTLLRELRTIKDIPKETKEVVCAIIQVGGLSSISLTNQGDARLSGQGSAPAANAPPSRDHRP